MIYIHLNSLQTNPLQGSLVLELESFSLRLDDDDDQKTEVLSQDCRERFLDIFIGCGNWMLGLRSRDFAGDRRDMRQKSKSINLGSDDKIHFR